MILFESLPPSLRILDHHFGDDADEETDYEVRNDLFYAWDGQEEGRHQEWWCHNGIVWR